MSDKDVASPVAPSARGALNQRVILEGRQRQHGQRGVIIGERALSAVVGRRCEGVAQSLSAGEEAGARPSGMRNG